MAKPPSADSILRNAKAQQKRFAPSQPIMGDYHLPNHSGTHHNLVADRLKVYHEAEFQNSVTLVSGVPTLIFDDTHSGHDKYRIRVDSDIMKIGGGSPIVDLMTFQTDGVNKVTVSTGVTFSIADLTQGSIPFIGASGLISEDNSNLFWDDTNNRLGIGTTNPSKKLQVEGGDVNFVQGNGLYNFYVGRQIGQAMKMSGNDNNFEFNYVQDVDETSEHRVDFDMTGAQTANQMNYRWRFGSSTSMQLISTDGGRLGIGTTSPQDKLAVSGGNIVVDKTSGIGIKVDNTTPTYGWRDLLGETTTRNTGATKPSFEAYNGAILQYRFSNGDLEHYDFHIPHDYVPGTDIHLHIHWSQISTTNTGGTLDFKYSAIYAKGHNQAAFTGTPITGTFTSADAGSTQYQHHITEVVISAATATAALFDRDDLEPDGVILMTLEMDANSLTDSSSVTDPFIHYVDIHYQSTNIATKDKVPDFYT